MKKNLILIFGAILLVSLASCNKSSIKTERVGISRAHFDDVFLTYLRNSMENYAEETKDLEIVAQDAKGDVSIQLGQVENFIAQDMNVVIVNPADTEATKKMTEKANNAGIPIVYVNRKPVGELGADAYFVGSDEFVAGKLQMEYLASKMNGEGNLAIMLGELSSNGTIGRTKGVKSVLKNYPNIHIVEEQTANFKRDQAMDLMGNWLSSGKKIDAVAANNDEMALGAVLAIKNAGLIPNKDILVGGVDGTPEALKAIKDSTLTVTIYQDAKAQGLGAIKAAYELAKEKKVPKITWIPFQLVTHDNYKKYLSS